MIGIDLFSGAGGLSLGAEMAGVNVAIAVESDPYAAQTYRVNHPRTMLSNLGQHELGVILVYGLMFFSYYAADYDWKYISLLAPMSWASLPISSAVQSQWKLLLYPMALISLLNIALVLCNLLCCNRPIQKETL